MRTPTTPPRFFKSWNRRPTPLTPQNAPTDRKMSPGRTDNGTMRASSAPSLRSRSDLGTALARIRATMSSNAGVSITHEAARLIQRDKADRFRTGGIE